MLYCVQPILPVFSQSFHLTPAQSSLSLSVTTAMMALGLLVTGPLSDAIGRKSVMSISLLLAAFFTLICATMSSWEGVLAMRALTGLALSGVAAVAMTWLSEELHPVFLSFSMGLYISGNSIGGLVGRLSTGMLADHFSWNVSLFVVGLFALAAAGLFSACCRRRSISAPARCGRISCWSTLCSSGATWGCRCCLSSGLS